MLTTSSFNRKYRQAHHLRDLLVEVFTANFQTILIFLPQQNTQSIKLICRGVYYIFVTQQIWTGIRSHVVDLKMENFDDLDFIEDEPKMISKEDKNIRIHSLKKSGGNIRVREASNIKQKKIALNTINNQMPFRNTQIGFKRLLKPSTIKQKSNTEISHNYLMDLVQIPRQFSATDLLINAKEPWSLNVHRANNLCLLIKKWNQFHHKLLANLKEPEREMGTLIKKCIRVDKNLTNYCRLFETQPYKSIKQFLDGSLKNLLIDEQLNRLGKVFINGHIDLLAINEVFENFISKMHEDCVKLTKLANTVEDVNTNIVQTFSAIQDSIDQNLNFYSECPQLIKLTLPSFFEIYDHLIEKNFEKQFQLGCSTSILSINFSHILKLPDYFQILFSTLQNLTSKLLKLSDQKDEENMTINLILSKIRNYKTIFTHLWNVSKYFSKLMKQIEVKQKKKSKDNKLEIIRHFVDYYKNYESDSNLVNSKSTLKIEKQMSQFKVRINSLKGSMQNE